MATHRDYASISYWLESCGDDLTPRDPLDGDLEVDIAILGAGYSGLWTAYYLLRQSPSLEVAIVEQEIAGYGASGRNGGWCSGSYPVSLPQLAERYGTSAALDVYHAMIDTVDEVGRVAERESIDCDYEKGGVLRLARGRHELLSLQESRATYIKLGLPDHYQMLTAEETAERVRVTGTLASLFTPHCATVHPAKLARGLARVVERMGGKIFEQTRALRYDPGPSPVLHTERGSIRARRAVVLVGEAYLSQFDQLSRQIVPLYTYIVATEPLDDEQWERIGWSNRECISSSRMSVDYLSKTADGRITFGGLGAPYHFGSAIKDEFNRKPAIHNRLRWEALEWFPPLRPNQFSHAWGGTFGVPRDWTPTFAFDPRTGIATARGYVGLGVATTNLAGRILADLICERESELTQLPIVGHRSPDWEPEPLRYLGIRFVQKSVARAERKSERRGRPVQVNRLARRFRRR